MSLSYTILDGVAYYTPHLYVGSLYMWTIVDPYIVTQYVIMCVCPITTTFSLSAVKGLYKVISIS